MNVKDLEARIASAVDDYLAEEEAYGDDATLAIDPASVTVEIVEEAPADADASELYYVRVMDLVKMSLDNPGQWIADADSVAALAADIAG